jgi:hypothetical protein
VIGRRWPFPTIVAKKRVARIEPSPQIRSSQEDYY